MEVTRTIEVKQDFARYVCEYDLNLLVISELRTSPLIARPAPKVIPSLQGDASTQAPPDLPSFIFKERIVYLVCVEATGLNNFIIISLLAGHDIGAIRH